MLFDTKTQIPSVYSKYRDIRVINTLLDILLTTIKYDIDNIVNLYNADKCKDNLLRYLAQTLNYEYNDLDTVTVNRKILSTFVYMMRYKGSETGIKMATALSLTTLDMAQDNMELNTMSVDYIKALSELKITYVYDGVINGDSNIQLSDIPPEYLNKPLIIIDYPNTYTQVRYLIDYVRPVGMYILLRAIVENESSTDFVVLSQTLLNTIQYKPSIRSAVEKSEVNFSAPIDDIDE